MKLNKDLFPILELFRDIETMFLNEFENLVFLSFKFGQIKMLETNCIDRKEPEIFRMAS